MNEEEKRKIPQWLVWAREIQALAQTGNHYAENQFQTERYQRLAEIAAEMMADPFEISAEDLAADFKAELGYSTPRVDVRAAVFNTEGHILLVQDWLDKSWSMPGGWADVGDVPSVAAERETKEEAGLDVKATRVLGVYDANRAPRNLEIYHAYKLVYLCEWVGGRLQTSHETLAVEFFAPDQLPTDLSSRTTSQQFEHAFQVLANPQLLTFFD